MSRGAITIQANICMLPRGPGLMPRSCPEAASTMSSLQRPVTWSESRETGFAPGVVRAWSLWAHSWRFPETISYSQGTCESTSDPQLHCPRWHRAKPPLRGQAGQQWACSPLLPAPPGLCGCGTRTGRDPPSVFEEMAKKFSTQFFPPFPCI